MLKMLAIGVSVLALGAGSYTVATGHAPWNAGAPAASDSRRIALTISGPKGSHDFQVEVAKTEPEQQRGLMFRTDIPKDGGMLFAPYPPDGGAPRVASFWMKNTPSSLDILFIRPDHTIARIAENTVPLSETPIPSGEPVAAILEINGGRAGELGIDEGDKVSWGQ